MGTHELNVEELVVGRDRQLPPLGHQLHLLALPEGVPRDRKGQPKRRHLLRILAAAYVRQVPVHLLVELAQVVEYVEELLPPPQRPEEEGREECLHRNALKHRLAKQRAQQLEQPQVLAPRMRQLRGRARVQQPGLGRPGEEAKVRAEGTGAHLGHELPQEPARVHARLLRPRVGGEDDYEAPLQADAPEFFERAQGVLHKVVAADLDEDGRHVGRLKGAPAS